MAAEVHQIQHVLLKAAAVATRASLQEPPANTGVSADHTRNLLHISASGFEDSSDLINRTNPVGQEEIGSRLSKITALNIGAYIHSAAQVSYR